MVLLVLLVPFYLVIPQLASGRVPQAHRRRDRLALLWLLLGALRARRRGLNGERRTSANDLDRLSRDETPQEIREAREDWEAHRRFGDVTAYQGPRLPAPEVMRLARPNPMS